MNDGAAGDRDARRGGLGAGREAGIIDGLPRRAGHLIADGDLGLDGLSRRDIHLYFDALLGGWRLGAQAAFGVSDAAVYLADADAGFEDRLVHGRELLGDEIEHLAPVLTCGSTSGGRGSNGELQEIGEERALRLAGLLLGDDACALVTQLLDLGLDAAAGGGCGLGIAARHRQAAAVD